MTTTRKIGMLTGSLRAGSLSSALARGLPDLAPPSMQLVMLPSIRDVPHFDQDLFDEGLPDGVSSLAQAAAACDGILVVTPEYNWSIPGVLKNALDWLSRLKPQPLADMPVAVMTVSPGILGGARSHAPIRHVLASLDCRIMAKPEVQIAKAKTKIDVETSRITDEETRGFLVEHLAKFDRFCR